MGGAKEALAPKRQGEQVGYQGVLGKNVAVLNGVQGRRSLGSRRLEGAASGL